MSMLVLTGRARLHQLDLSLPDPTLQHKEQNIQTLSRFQSRARYTPKDILPAAFLLLHPNIFLPPGSSVSPCLYHPAVLFPASNSFSYGSYTHSTPSSSLPFLVISKKKCRYQTHCMRTMRAAALVGAVAAAAVLAQVSGQAQSNQMDFSVNSLSGSGMMPVDDSGACTFEELVDFDGNDLDGSWLGETGTLYTNGKKAAQAYDCAVGCLANPLCKFYTYLQKRCWYKVSDEGRKWSDSKTAVSGACVRYETTSSTTTIESTTQPPTTTLPPTTEPRPGCDTLGSFTSTLTQYKSYKGFLKFFFFLLSFQKKVPPSLPPSVIFLYPTFFLICKKVKPCLSKTLISYYLPPSPFPNI